jgi:undecaprenyl-diphosphatase
LSVFEALVLGVVQGLTEFLPISSDGHLWVAYRLFGDTPNLTFEVFLHFATLLVLILYFWRELVQLTSSVLPANRERTRDRRLVLLIVLATAVSGGIALFMEPIVEHANASAAWVALGFFATAALMTIAEAVLGRGPHIADASDLPLTRAIPLGALQMLAALPGVSRSGSVISAGMYAGLGREAATRFSFLLGVPIITLATIRSGFHLATGTASLPPLLPSLVGFAGAAVAGYAAIWGLLTFVKRHSLYWFAAYTALVGTAILVSAVL